jgi:hypothetical protein
MLPVTVGTCVVIEGSKEDGRNTHRVQKPLRGKLRPAISLLIGKWKKNL